MGTEKDDSVDLQVAEVAGALLATSRPNHAAFHAASGGRGFRSTFIYDEKDGRMAPI